MPGYERCHRLAAEGFGTALLGATVAGTEIMAGITTRGAAHTRAPQHLAPASTSSRSVRVCRYRPNGSLDFVAFGN
jgi:hypothetical protein